jgi:hypothetical protein
VSVLYREIIAAACGSSMEYIKRYVDKM